jgi:hypothetical protein
MQSSLYPPISSCLLGPDILLSTLFSNTPNLCSPLSVRDQVLHPYNTTVDSYVAVRSFHFVLQFTSEWILQFITVK